MWVCPKCGRSFKNTEQSHYCGKPPATIEEYIAAQPEEIRDYLMIFQYGMPPHGGLGIGLERLTMKLLDEQNVRETTLFPRDVTRLEP